MDRSTKIFMSQKHLVYVPLRGGGSHGHVLIQSKGGILLLHFIHHRVISQGHHRVISQGHHRVISQGHAVVLFSKGKIPLSIVDYIITNCFFYINFLLGGGA